MRSVETSVGNSYGNRTAGWFALAALCVAWIAGVTGATAAYAQGQNYDLSNPRWEYQLVPGPMGNCPVRVSLRPAPWLLIRPGYCPIVVQVRPAAGLVFPSDGMLTVRITGYGLVHRGATVDVPVKAGQTSADAELLYNSAVGDRNMSIVCWWNGAPQSNMQSMFYVSYSNVLSNEFNQRLTLISEEQSKLTTERKMAMAEIRDFQIPISISGIDPSTNTANYYWKTHFADAANLPEDWLRVGAFDQIYADIEDLERVNASGWQTLRDYVWCGGTLVVSNSTDEERIKKFVSADWSHPIAPPLSFNGRVFQAGFGKVAFAGTQFADKYANADELRSHSRFERLSNDIGNEYWNWLIPEVGKTPVWMFFAFVLLVVGIAAPAILHWSQRVKRRIWIVIAIPTLAIASTTSLFLYAAIKDGWESLVRVRSLTYVNSDGDGAAWSRQSYFASSVPANRVRVAPNTELIPLKGKRESQSMQYQSDSEQIYSGLLPPRQQRQFSLTHPVRDLKVFRRTADIDSTLGQPSMFNAYDGTILVAVYCDSEGRIFQSAAVPAGERMVWEASSADAARDVLLKLFNQQPLVVPDDAPDQNSRSILEIFRSRYRYWYPTTAVTETFTEESRWRDALSSWDKNSAGKFVVFVDRAPYVDRCLPDCQEKSSLHTIVGKW